MENEYSKKCSFKRVIVTRLLEICKRCEHYKIHNEDVYCGKHSLEAAMMDKKFEDRIVTDVCPYYFEHFIMKQRKNKNKDGKMI